MKFDCREDILQLTPLWQGDRFPDGRPRVPDALIRRMAKITTEEAWAVLWGKGYKSQFVGDWKVINTAGEILVGRAVTATFVPRRPDLHDCLWQLGTETEGRSRRAQMNSWVIETLVEDDVMVVDMFDKIYEGTFSGGNLSTAVATRTKRGQVIWGGIRDIQQVMEIENVITYYRGNDPTPIRDVTCIGINTPCRIGPAVCMPGDVVLGTPAGILFIPPHLADEAAVHAEKTRLREIFQFERLRQGVYDSAQMDSQWSPEIKEDFREWRKTHTPEDLTHLNWDEDTATDRAQTGQETRL